MVTSFDLELIGNRAVSASTRSGGARLPAAWGMRR